MFPTLIISTWGEGGQCLATSKRCIVEEVTRVATHLADHEGGREFQTREAFQTKELLKYTHK